MKTSLTLAVPLLLATTFGCASMQKRFDAVYPGMSSQGVVETMHGGPTRAQEFGDGSTAWYYGEDRCVLIREDKVVAKERTQDSTTVDAVVVSLKDSRKALCAPQGSAEARHEQRIETPVGSFKGTIDPKAIKEKVIETRDTLLGEPTR